MGPTPVKKCRARGFTILEVLIAFLILTIGIVSLVALFETAAFMHRRSIDMARATLLAKMQFAYYESLLRPGVAIESEIVNESGAPHGYPEFVFDVQFEEYDPAAEAAGFGSTLEHAAVIITITVRRAGGFKEDIGTYRKIVLKTKSLAD